MKKNTRTFIKMAIWIVCVFLGAYDMIVSLGFDGARPIFLFVMANVNLLIMRDNKTNSDVGNLFSIIKLK